MCGDFDDQERIDEELFEHFVELIGQLGVDVRQAGNGAPARLETEAERATYMDALFRAGLTRCVNDAANLPIGERMDALAGAAIVFARLAGFLTAQFPPDSDLFRMVTGAVMDGHAEPATLS